MAEVKLEDAPVGVRTYYDKGVAAMERGNFDYAMDMFSAALQMEPRLLKLRQLFRAAAIRQTASRPAGKLATARAMGKLIKTASLLKKDPLQSLELSEELLRTDPLNGRFAKANCDAAVAAQLPEIAILTLEILNDNAPPSPAVLEPLAELYRETEQFDMEYKCRGRIVKLKPGNSEAAREMKDAAARLTMGKAGWKQAESIRSTTEQSAAPAAGTDALEQAKRKVVAEPQNINYRRALADLQLQQKQFDDAIRTLETCQDLSSAHDPQIARKLTTAREHRLSFLLAEAEDAGDPEKVSNLRKQLAEMRLVHSALQAERYPNDLQLKFEYGKQLFESGKLTEAIQQFQLAQRNPQRRIRSLFYLAQAFKAKGQIEIAREQLETGLAALQTMDKTRKEFLYELGLICEGCGDAANADVYFREIYTVDIGYRDVASKVENSDSA